MISVVTPFFNAAQTLPRYLEALSLQTNKNFEVILVDDGSTDQGSEIIEEFIETSSLRIKLTKIKNSGPGIARNKALKAVNGEIISFTDADCIPRHDWIKNITSIFENQDVQMISGKVTCSELIIYPWKISPAGQTGITANLHIRRVALGDLKFNPTYNGLLGEDTDLVKRMEQKLSATIGYDESIIVEHPVNRLGLKKVIERARARIQEVALIKHYGTSAYSSMNMIYKPLIFGRFSAMFIFFVFSIIAGGLLILSNNLLILLLIAFFAVIIFVTFGYKVLAHSETQISISIKDRFVTLFFFCIYNFVYIYSRLQGSIKYRKIVL